MDEKCSFERFKIIIDSIKVYFTLLTFKIVGYIFGLIIKMFLWLQAEKYMFANCFYGYGQKK